MKVSFIVFFYDLQIHELHKITYHFDTFNMALYINVKMQHKLNYSFTALVPCIESR